MNFAAIEHRPVSEYCHGLDEGRIVYRLRCARGDLERVTLSYGDTACRVTPIIFTPVEMELAASDEYHDYWQAVVESKYYRVYYYFTLYGGGEWTYYYGGEFTKSLVDDRSEYFKLPINHRADIARVPDWARDAVVYNIFPDSFASGEGSIAGSGAELIHNGQKSRGRLGGTLDGVAANAKYIRSMGFNCVYLNPIFAAGEYHKYDTIDYMHVDPCFGGDEAMRRMVKALHAEGIRVIIDGVFNHCGWRFWAFEDVVKNQERSRYRDWFYGLSFPVERPADPEAYPGYVTYAYERMMPKLNTANAEVREYFCGVGQYWIEEFGVDGWRLDVASEVDDGFWQAFRSAVKAVKPDALLVGEVWETARHWLDGDMFDSTMNYDFRKHCRRFFAEGDLDAYGFAARCSDMLMRYKLQMTGVQMNLLDSHDVSRFLSVCGGDKRRYRLAVLFLMTFVGMPMLFYGDELGIEGIAELDYRSPMPWGGGDTQLSDFVRRAIALRHERSELRHGDFRVISARPGSGLLAFERRCGGKAVAVCLNAAGTPAQAPVCGETLWADGLDGGVLAPWGFAVFEK